MISVVWVERGRSKEIYKYMLVKRGKKNRMNENKNGATTSNKEREERRGGKGK